MSACTGLTGRWFGHDFRPRVEIDDNRFGREDSLSLTEIRELIETGEGNDAEEVLRQLAKVIESRQGGMTRTRYLGDICARCGEFRPAPGSPQKTASVEATPVTAPTPRTPPASAAGSAVAVSPAMPGLRATIKVGEIRP